MTAAAITIPTRYPNGVPDSPLACIYIRAVAQETLRITDEVLMPAQQKLTPRNDMTLEE